MSDLVLGITASRTGITDTQRIWLWEQLQQAQALHHGACIGGDEESHDIAQLIGLRIYVHPPINEKFMMPREKWLPEHVVYAPQEYHVRNHAIVNACKKLLVLPNSPDERLRSGTWATYRYSMDLEHTTHVCFPDGEEKVYFDAQEITDLHSA